VSPASVPVEGQLVTVRRQRFVITGVQPSTLHSPPQHLLTLSSIEDDGLGEELQVIWEMEPGAAIHEQDTLPSPAQGFDAPNDLSAFLLAVRWGVVASVDTKALYAPFRSGVSIEDYQLDPLVRALQMPRVNLLIADDVGLGKTVETGLIIQELILRHRARTVLVVCPATLQQQWKTQMRDHFGLDFKIVDTDLVKQLRRRRGLHVNPWSHFPRLIVSMDYLKRDRSLSRLRELLPGPQDPIFPRRFDMLIIDEAHNIAPSGRGHYAVESQRTRAIRAIAPHFEHKIFLSATPHNGYSESFQSLLELLDNQRFHRAVKPDPRQLKAVMVRRLKRDITDWQGKPRFPGRQLSTLKVQYADAERAAHNHLSLYQKALLSDADPQRVTACAFVLKLLKKRLFSSPQAFFNTLNKHMEHVNKLSSSSASSPAPARLSFDDIADDDDFSSDDGADADEAFASASELLASHLSPAVQHHLTALHTWANAVVQRLSDSKADALAAWLLQHVCPNNQWSKTRVIIFTEYRDTQSWLLQTLAHSLGSLIEKGEKGRIMCLHGGLDSPAREAIKAAFQADPDLDPVRILLATDSASEGIDLQRHCSHLIHYEIPWNPNRMEQRNGRIDRHGQRDTVRIFHFAPSLVPLSGSSADVSSLEGDLEFLMRAVQKVDNIREDLGSVGLVISEQIEQVMLGKRTRRDLDLSAGRKRQTLSDITRFERDLKERIETLKNHLDQTRQDLEITPRNVQRIVEVALRLAQQKPLSPAVITNPDGSHTPAFRLPSFAGTWSACAQGIAHPHTHQLRPVVFEHSAAVSRDDAVYAHLNHRLVQMCLRLLRAEIWKPAGQQTLRRISACISSDPHLSAPVIVASGRLVILGKDNIRLHEEIIFAGGPIEAGKLKISGLQKLQQLLATSTPAPAPSSFTAQLQAIWPAVERSLLKALIARRDDRFKSLSSQLQAIAERETQTLAAILRELADAIRNEIDPPTAAVAPSPQLLLPLSLDEQDQKNRDHDALKRRLIDLESESERELQALRDRYSLPSARLFPVAVQCILPQTMKA
jgi:superfamily II DNA or RNA helicase